jgi:alkanesulfonate monooxygenase SsuD/methylene tetrahydromethanopterin reductase-like flavin-dependent oxidoreductase (luciferase family)
MIEGWYGIPFVKPRTRVKETVYLLRKMLAGEKIDWQGETVYSRGFRLNIPVHGPVPIYLAALRPGMLELAGEIADGVVLNLAHPRVIPRMLESIDAGAKRSGRRVENLEVAMLLNSYVSRDVERARKDFAAVAANYFSTGVYSQFLAWSGFEKEAARITEGFREKDRAKTLGAFAPEVLDEFAAIGSPDRCRALARRYWEAGVNTCIVISSSPLKEEHSETLRAFTPAAMGAQ